MYRALYLYDRPFSFSIPTEEGWAQRQVVVPYQVYKLLIEEIQANVAV